MSAITNNRASQPLPVLTPSMHDDTDQRRLMAIRSIDLNEMQSSAGVAKLFVLVAAPPATKTKLLCHNPLRTNSCSGSSIPLNLFEVFKRTITQSGSIQIDGDAVIGDVRSISSPWKPIGGESHSF